MVTPQRMKDLETFVQFWKEAKARAETQLDRLIDAKKIGIVIVDEQGNDILPQRIVQEGEAVSAFSDGLNRAEGLLNRAKQGWDV